MTQALRNGSARKPGHCNPAARPDLKHSPLRHAP